MGCDIGTQSTKAVLISDDGVVHGTAWASHQVDYLAPRQVEQDPNEWINAVSGVLTQLAAASPGPISHISFASQVDGVVPVDDARIPVHPALIWMDRRATEQTKHIKDNLGEDRVFEITGLNCDASHAAPKMMWLNESLDTPVSQFLPVGSYVTSWLTGTTCQDEANASSSMLFDVVERTASEELFDISGIDPSAFPEIRESVDIAGQVESGRARSLGLSSNTDVLVGTGDDHAAALGAGAVVPGIVADVVGTAEPIGTSSDRVVFDSERLLETHLHAVPGMWFVENPGFVSGGSVRWVARLLDIDDSEVVRLAAEAPPGAGGLTFIPALSGALAPRWREYFRGSFTGISLDHGPAELCRAVVEGCTFAFRDVIDRIEAMQLPVARIHVTGGGTKSDFWLQMKADVTGRAVYSTKGEGTAVGAASLAATAAGWFPDVESAASALSTVNSTPFEPDPPSDAYEEAYQRYRMTFDTLEQVYQS